jgi:hypothetical protein
MTQADRIRKFAIDHYIQPAGRRADRSVAVRTGDVHESMGLLFYPAVCAALGTEIFETQARIRRTACEGPLKGASLLLTFALL